MQPDSDFALAQHIATTLTGKFWQVTAGEWWVVVEGISSQKLVILTNDPFGATFTPKQLTMSLADLKRRVVDCLVQAEIITEDGSWAIALAS
jgi:hypothetical protein